MSLDGASVAEFDPDDGTMSRSGLLPPPPGTFYVGAR